MSEQFERLAKALSPRYRLERPIDRGVSAQVYLAEDTLRSRRVAIKILRPEMTASMNADRFKAEIDGRSDIYSLACVTYEMLCGRPPFMGTPIAVMSRHATAEPRALVAICPDMPHSISYVLSR